MTELASIECTGIPFSDLAPNVAQAVEFIISKLGQDADSYNPLAITKRRALRPLRRG